MAGNTTPTLYEVLDQFITKALSKVYTALPARVLSFDGTTVRVQPLTKIKSNDGDQLSLPVIGGVPVVYPGGTPYRVIFPITIGDTVLLICCSSSIEDWLTSGSDTVDTASARRHDLSDAVAIPGLSSIVESVANPSPSPSEMVIGSNATPIVAGLTDIRLGSVAATELAAIASLVLSRLQHMTDTYNNHTHGSFVAPPTTVVPPGNPALMFQNEIPPLVVPSVACVKVRII
jgi:hypothetical protein